MNLLVVLLPSAPVANPDSYNVDRNGTFSVPAPGVLGNDTASVLYGADRGTGEQPGDGGSVTLAPDGAVSYLPAAGFVGTTSFQYRVSATRS